MSSQQLIVNEVLAFIIHAIDTMDEVSILQICKSNFKEEEVCSAKSLVFQSLGKADQMPSRRRDGGEKSLQDIITLLKETDPDHVPVFVAKRLDRLPPVTFDHVDVTRLLKDITSLKFSQAELMKKLEASEAAVSDLRAEVVSLRNTVSISRSPEHANVNTRRGAQNASIGSLCASPDANNSPAAPRPAETSAAPMTLTSHVSVSTPRAYAAAAAAPKPAPRRPEQSKIERPTTDNDGFTKVERKKKKKPVSQNKCGNAPTGPNHLLFPATPTTQLYVSRLHHKIETEHVVEYVRLKTKWSLRVEKLVSRHETNFNSFVLRVPTTHLSTFTAEEFWPKGVVFRRFRGRLPDTTMRRTSPTKCAT